MYKVYNFEDTHGHAEVHIDTDAVQAVALYTSGAAGERQSMTLSLVVTGQILKFEGSSDEQKQFFREIVNEMTDAIKNRSPSQQILTETLYVSNTEWNEVMS